MGLADPPPPKKGASSALLRKGQGTEAKVQGLRERAIQGLGLAWRWDEVGCRAQSCDPIPVTGPR